MIKRLLHSVTLHLLQNPSPLFNIHLFTMYTAAIDPGDEPQAGHGDFDVCICQYLAENWSF